jgi:U3 small nucleolar RNA-associated protein 18
MGNVAVTGGRSFFYLYDSSADKSTMVPNILGRAEQSWERSVASPDGRTLALCGNDGYVVLFDMVCKCGMMHFKLNGSVRALVFTPDGSEVMASGSDGDVYRWDLRSSKCLERFANQDGTITSSSSRVSSVPKVESIPSIDQKHAQLAMATHAPVKSIMNLKTSADRVPFNTDGQNWPCRVDEKHRRSNYCTCRVAPLCQSWATCGASTFPVQIPSPGQ